jgi:hypothetical protein
VPQRLGLIISIAMLAWLAIHGPQMVVRACDYTAPWVEGFLGRHWYAPSDALEVPRNAAVLNADLTLVATGERIPLVPLAEHPSLFRPEELLPVGATVQSRNVSATVADVIDEQPPSTPVLLEGTISRSRSSGCGDTDSCDGLTFIKLDFEPGEDDMTPPSLMSTVLFVGATQDEAATMAPHEGEWLAPGDPTHLSFPLGFDITHEALWDRSPSRRPGGEPFATERATANSALRFHSHAHLLPLPDRLRSI